MLNANEHTYTVNILFSHDLSRILLVRKNRTDFINKLNGPGGAGEPRCAAAEKYARSPSPAKMRESVRDDMSRENRAYPDP